MWRGVMMLALAVGGMAAGVKYDWGTYDPGTYINVRSRMLNSPSLSLDTINAGVMWGGAHGLHFSILDSTYLFSYLYNSPGRFAVQNISDQHSFANLTSILQIDQDSHNAWELRIQGTHAPRTKYSKKEPFLSVVFHISLIGDNHAYHFAMVDASHWAIKDGENQTLFTVEAVVPGEQTYKGEPLTYYCKEVKNTRGFAWNAEDYAKSALLNDKVMARDPNSFGALPNTVVGERCNLLLLHSVPKMNFEVSYRFNDPKIGDLGTQVMEFDEELERRFGPIAEGNKPFARALLSNLLGGIGYFTGSVKIAGKGKGPFGKLFSCTPSRITFPRGFLWDEGFHLSIVCRWDRELCTSILQSWLNTQDESGWIPREQIRGEEAEGRVPGAFIPQNDSIANPPSLLFPIMYLYDSLQLIAPEALPTDPVYKALEEMYPKLVKWLRWLYRTQLAEGYPAWAGRSSDHNLASGFDDYPRSQIVNSKERHLDLHCWLMFFTKSLSKLATFLDRKEDAEMFTRDYTNMRQHIKEWFFDPASGLYNDFIGTQWVPKSTKQLRFSWRGDNKCGEENPLGNGQPSECNPYSDSPCCSEFGWCGSTASHCRCQKCRVSLPLEKRSDYEPVDMFSPHIGYVTLFPLIHGEIEVDDPGFSKLLSVIRDSNELWTRFGLRSLSKSSELYKTGENYWRGNIWININYLVLRALKLYYWENAKAREVYTELRENVINIVKLEWESSYSLFEQYAEENGRGRRARAFYGWSAVVLLAMQEKY